MGRKTHGPAVHSCSHGIQEIFRKKSGGGRPTWRGLLLPLSEGVVVMWTVPRPKTELCIRESLNIESPNRIIQISYSVRVQNF